MVSASTLLKHLLSVKHCVIESNDLVTDGNSVNTLKVYSHSQRSHSDWCPVCGKRCSVYDRSSNYRKRGDLDISSGMVVESTPPQVYQRGNLFVLENSFAGYLVNIHLSHAILSEIKAPPH